MGSSSHVVSGSYILMAGYQGRFARRGGAWPFSREWGFDTPASMKRRKIKSEAVTRPPTEAARFREILG
jgi:hypothetical protein